MKILAKTFNMNNKKQTNTNYEIPIANYYRYFKIDWILNQETTGIIEKS